MLELHFHRSRESMRNQLAVQTQAAVLSVPSEASHGYTKRVLGGVSRTTYRTSDFLGHRSLAYGVSHVRSTLLKYSVATKH